MIRSVDGLRSVMPAYCSLVDNHPTPTTYSQRDIRRVVNDADLQQEDTGTGR